VDTTVTSGRDGLEEGVGDVDGAGYALWAGVDDFAFDRSHAIEVDVDVLVAVRVKIGVDTVRHVGLIHCDEKIAVGASFTARSETNGDIVVSHVASGCTGSSARRCSNNWHSCRLGG